MGYRSHRRNDTPVLGILSEQILPADRNGHVSTAAETTGGMWNETNACRFTLRGDAV